ncbi:MarR family transcriptional regulator [uncultured Ruminococcus sp.]|uniref:MarR family winged helix-turn-helix transcriptional regulator n=1 Tax=uncultured Ruminococcus sp. TaxID=165186 RepID=UPI002600A92C|nr:MarR family transcriptional regulator [uncultured Ruminococcus sp.]
MNNDARAKCIMTMYEIYPISRKLVFDTFDRKKYDITRTQQIIMLSLSLCGTLTMSKLAAKINTSNEQATRAVAQLVDKGFIVRMHNPENRRVINIKLTEEAEIFFNKMKAEIIDDLIEKFSCLSNEEMEEFSRSLENVSDVLKKVMK